MGPSRHDRVMHVLAEAMEIAEPAARAEFLSTACDGDETLRLEVEELLNVDANARHAFESAGQQIHDAPQYVGPYRILEQLGEGGMGVVYRAEQIEPVRRIVAVKLVKLGMDSKQVVARFESERQALAMMNHPNVARVYDAGVTDVGRPYFVMEYVAGEPITRFCDKHNYTTRQRLELFLQVCAGVQHAHHKALVHRDLKPSNILVAFEDGEPRPKVIDFGVAKAMAQQKLTDRTLITETGQLLGTLEYMSPEQADLSSLDIDTRSDVYSLGVVLYELLTGALPFDPQSLRGEGKGGGGFDKVRRIIREVEPPRPSVRLAALGAEEAAFIAKRRRAAPTTLHQELRAELEWIPLKAMSKDRSLRYRSPDELAEDIRNYLSRKPLSAGPPSGWYRTKKLLARNKVPVAAVAAVFVALLLGVIGTSVALVGQSRARAEADRHREAAERQRDQAQAVLQFVTEDVLAGATPARMPDASVRDTIVRVMIDPAAESVGKRFANQPATEAAIRSVLAQCYVLLGRADLAQPHAERSLDQRRRILNGEDPLLAESMNVLATVFKMQRKHDQAEALHRAALDLRQRVLGAEHIDTLTSLNNLAGDHEDRGQLDEAERLYREALAGNRKVLGEDHRYTWTTLNNLAKVLQKQKRLDEAEPIVRDVVERYRAGAGEDHPDTLSVKTNLALLLRSRGKHGEAARVHRDVLDRRRRVLGDDHPATLLTLNNLALTLHALGKLDEAEPLLREAVERRERVEGRDHPDVIQMLSNLAVLLRASGKLEEAVAMLREATERSGRAMGNNHPRTLDAMHMLGISLLNLNRAGEAEPVMSELNRRAADAAALPARKRAAFRSSYGQCLVKLGKYADGERELRATLATLDESENADPVTRREALAALAVVCEQTDRPEQAMQLRSQIPAAPANATRPATIPD